jgi:polyhydroxyalkanoate synthase subunit PhaE
MEKESTNWSEMANHLANAWVEVGTQMWKNWFDLVGSVPASGTVTDPKPGAKSATQEQFAQNQELFARFIKMSFDAWKDISPKVESGGDWQQVLKKYTEQMSAQLQEFSAETSKGSQDVNYLWQIYTQEMQKFSQLWLTTLGVPVKPLDREVNRTSEPWFGLNNLYWNLLYEQNFGNLTQSPTLGVNREFTGKVLRAFNSWTDLYRGSINYQRMLAGIQIRSFEDLMQELVLLTKKGEKVDDWRQFQQLWSRIADRVFEEEFRKEDNLKIRGTFLNALNTYKPHQQELVELWLKTLNMPVRSEVDEVHKNIYELRKESKTLNKKLAHYEAIAQETEQLRSTVAEARQHDQELRQEVQTLTQKLANYEAIAQETEQLRSTVAEARQHGQELRQEVETLTQKLANYEAIAQETEQLRQEILTLKQSFAEYSATEPKAPFPFNLFNFNRNKT